MMNASEFVDALQQAMRKVIFGSTYIFPLDTVVGSMVYGGGEIDDNDQWGTTIYVSITLSHRNVPSGQRIFEMKLGRIPYPPPPEGETQMFYNNNPVVRKKIDKIAKARAMKFEPAIQAYVVNSYLNGAVDLEALRLIFRRVTNED